MFTPFVISQPHDDYRAQVIRSQVIGFEINKKRDSDEFFVHSVIVGGATGPGGLYSNKTKAESVVNLFCDYLNDYSIKHIGKDFIFPDDKSINDNGQPIDEEEGMAKTNQETASAIDYIHKIQELTGAILIKCKKWWEGDLFPTFMFSTTGDDDCDFTMEIYYDDDTGWKITSRSIGFDYEALKDGVVPFLQVLNYCQDVIKYEDIRKEFGIKEEEE